MSAKQKLQFENIGRKIGLHKQKPSIHGSKKLKMSMAKQLINNIINIVFEFENYNTIPLGFVTTNTEVIHNKQEKMSYCLKLLLLFRNSFEF